MMRSMCVSMCAVVGTTDQHFDQYSWMSTEPPNKTVQATAGSLAVWMCAGVFMRWGSRAVPDLFGA